MSYKLYKEMIEAYKSNDEQMFIVAARNWIEDADKNPFEDKEAHKYFFDAKKYCRKWRNGGIDCRSAKRNMIENIRQIAILNIGYPADLIEEEEQKEKDLAYQKQIQEKEKEIKKVKIETQENKENKEYKEEDFRYVMLAMVKAYNTKNDINFKQFAIHLMEISDSNPFGEGTEEYSKFEEMQSAYEKHNMRRLFVVSEQLCDIINNTEIYPEHIKPKKVVLDEPKKVLGVPEEEKEKKSWFNFLHPWKKEGEQDDSK